MLEEVSNGCLAFGLNGLLVQMDLDVGCAVSFGLLDFEDATFFSKNTENGIGGSDMCLHPFLVFNIVVLEAFHSSEDEVEPTEVDNVPSLLLGELGQKSSLHILEQREVEGHTIGLAFFVEGCDFAEDAAPSFVGLVEGGNFLAVKRRREIWFFVEQAA